MPRSPRSPQARRRLGLRGWVSRLGCSLLVALVTLEICLRLAGWALLSLRRHEADLQMAQEPGAFRMLHIGESTTFGLGVQPEEAYPAILARILEQRRPERRFVSIDRGVPGLVTSAMERTLGEKLAVVRPDLVTILAGANDYNEELNGLQAWDESWLPGPVARLVSGLRVYKALRLALELMRPEVRVDHGEVIYYHHGGSKNLLYETPRDEPKVAEVTLQLESNLRKMIAACQKAGALVVLVGYIQSVEENKVLERVAKETGVPYVSTYLEPEARSPGLFLEDGWHPSPAGHRHIAERIAAVLEPLISTRVTTPTQPSGLH
jgi:lysophospholipase L1-like esterase